MGSNRYVYDSPSGGGETGKASGDDRIVVTTVERREVIPREERKNRKQTKKRSKEVGIRRHHLVISRGMAEAKVSEDEKSKGRCRTRRTRFLQEA